jgi:transcriptional regulator with XRE-family HTH domain
VMDGEKIRAMRKARDLSRNELAKEADVAPSSVRSVKRGERVRATTG